MIFRENDERYLSMHASADEGDGMDDDDDDDDDEVMDDDASDADADVDMEPGNGHELEIRRKCDGILDIVLVGEVPSSFLPILYDFNLTSVPPRRTFGTARLGTTTSSMVVFANGMVLSRLSVFP